MGREHGGREGTEGQLKGFQDGGTAGDGEKQWRGRSSSQRGSMQCKSSRGHVDSSILVVAGMRCKLELISEDTR